MRGEEEMTPEVIKRQMTDAEWQKVYDMSRDKNLYHNLCSSLFPAIYGESMSSCLLVHWALLFLTLSLQEWWAAPRTNFPHLVWVAHDFFRSSILPCCQCMLSYVFHAFGSHGLPPGSHFTSLHLPCLIVWPKKESCRRTTNPRSCLVVFISIRIIWSQSNWLVTSGGRSTVLLTRSFDHQLSSEFNSKSCNIAVLFRE